MTSDGELLSATPTRTGTSRDTPEHHAQPLDLRSCTTELKPITGLRIFAALWVVFHHFNLLVKPIYPSSLGFLTPLTDAGRLGVDVFFVLSGFIVTHTYLTRLGPRFSVRTTGSFLWARVCRLWPAFMAVTVSYGLFILVGLRVHPGVGWIGQSAELDVSVGGFLRQFFMVHLWLRPAVEGSAWVGPGWSVSAEWTVYLLFTLGVLALWRVRRWPPVALGVLSTVVAAGYATTVLALGQDYPYEWLVRVAAEFAGGALAYLSVRSLRLTDARRRLAGLVAVAVSVVSLGTLYLSATVGAAAVVTLLPVLVATLGLCGLQVRPADLLTRLLSSTVIVHGGRISYSLYLTHGPVNGIFQRLHEASAWPLTGPTALLPMIVLLSVSLLVADATWRFIEEPARRALRRLDPCVPRTRQAAPDLG